MATADNIKVPAGAIGAEQNLATWAGPYVTGMLENAQALAQTEFQPYQGALTAGASPLQTQAFQGLGALTIPQNITQAGTALGQVAQKAGQMGYTPGQFASTYQAPGQYQAGDFANRFTAPGQYQGAQFTNQFAAPGQYQASTFTPDQYSQQAIQPYMNPYLESVLEPQRREAQRQADIARTQMQSRMAQAGAYGGSRQAIMEAEAQRNLMTQLGDITGKGYATAFDTAQQQFAAEQARRMQAEQLREQSRQFGAQQGMSAAELQARYGLSAQQAQEASRQFGAQQGMTAAELQARYGLSADQAREASRQFATQQAAETARTGAQYGLEAQRLGEQSRQFGAGFGLDALSRQMQALQAQGALGTAESQVGLANLAAQMQGGAAQRAIEQEGLAADYAQYLRETAFPYEQLKFQQSMLAGLPIGATAYAQPSQDPFDAFIGGAQNLVAAINLLNPSLLTPTPTTPAATTPTVTTPTVTTPAVTTPAATTPTTTTPPPPEPAVVTPGGTNMSVAPGSNLISQSTSAPAVTPAPGAVTTTTPTALSSAVTNNQVFSQPSVIGGSFTPSPTNLGLGSLNSFGNQFSFNAPE